MNMKIYEFINILEEKNINLIKRFTFVDNGSSDIRILSLSDRETNFLHLKKIWDLVEESNME